MESDGLKIKEKKKMATARWQQNTSRKKKIVVKEH